MKFIEKLTKGKRKLIFFDLEGTQTSCEIIAIAAIKVQLDARYMIKQIDDVGFKKYVIPQDKIGHIITKLTGIDDELIKKEGITFEKAIGLFKKYIGKDLDQYMYVTYGNYDKKLLFSTSNKNNSFGMDFIKTISTNYIDFSTFLSKFMKDEKGNNYSLSESIVALGGQFKGIKHDPLSDTKNLVQLYDLFSKNKVMLKAEYKRLICNDPKLPKPISNAIKKLLSNQNVTPKDFEQYIDDYIK